MYNIFRRFVAWSPIFVVLFFAYVVSVGPALIISNRTKTGGRLVEIVYAPVFWLHENTPLRRPLDVYHGWIQEFEADLDLPSVVIEPTPQEFGNVTNESMIAGKKVHFEAELSRDFMPMCPPNGQRMGAFLKVSTADQAAFPAGVRAEKAWVIQDGNAWIPQFDGPNLAPAKDGAICLIATARGGPRWEPGSRVDVVVQLRDDDGGAHVLRVVNQRIERTE